MPKTEPAMRIRELSSLSIAATSPVSIEAAKGEGKRPTFSILGYTGAVMQVAGFFSPVIVDLGGLKASRDRIPIFLDHDSTRIIGQADSIVIDADGVQLTGTITGEDEDAAKVVTHAKNGFEWQASIGANIVRQEFLKAGEKATVNGREVVGPLLIAKESRLHETSFVAIGADNQTAANVAASKPSGTHNGAPTMFEQWLQAKGFDPTALDDTQKASLKAAFDAEEKAKEKPKPDPRKTQTLDEIVSAQKQEEERVNRITQITAEAIADRPVMVDEFDRMAKSAIEAKSTVAEFELAIMRVRASAAPGGYTRSRGDIRAGVRVIEAALAIGGGLDDPDKHFDEKTLDAAHDRFPHGLGLRDLLMMAARENGYSGHTSSDVRGLLQAAFAGGGGGGNVRASGFSTLSLPGILSNTANKFLTAGFNAVETGWREISARRSVRDFKTITSYSLTGGMIYEKVGPGGELKHATLGELSYTSRVETYGRMFAITRQDIINDDLGALTEVPRKLGRGAALKLNDVFWTEFLANHASFYTAGRGNLITGGGTVLSSTSLSSALAKFRKQTDPDGLPLAITPRILLVPPELEIVADELMTSTMMNTGGAATTTQVPNRNVWAGKYRVVQSSYISNSSYTGYSTTAWFLLADPADLPVIEVAFLNGRETPVVESADADFNTLGVQMRGYHDFGVAKQEYRAGVRSAGA